MILVERIKQSQNAQKLPLFALFKENVEHFEEGNMLELDASLTLLDEVVHMEVLEGMKLRVRIRGSGTLL